MRGFYHSKAVVFSISWGRVLGRLRGEGEREERGRGNAVWDIHFKVSLLVIIWYNCISLREDL